MRCKWKHFAPFFVNTHASRCCSLTLAASRSLFALSHVPGYSALMYEFHDPILPSRPILSTTVLLSAAFLPSSYRILGCISSMSLVQSLFDGGNFPLCPTAPPFPDAILLLLSLFCLMLLAAQSNALRECELYLIKAENCYIILRYFQATNSKNPKWSVKGLNQEFGKLRCPAQSFCSRSAVRSLQLAVCTRASRGTCTASHWGMTIKIAFYFITTNRNFYAEEIDFTQSSL